MAQITKLSSSSQGWGWLTLSEWDVSKVHMWPIILQTDTTYL